MQLYGKPHPVFANRTETVVGIEPPAAADIWLSRRIFVTRISAEKIRLTEISTTGLIANSKRSSLSADRLHKITFIHDNCKLAFQ